MAPRSFFAFAQLDVGAKVNRNADAGQCFAARQATAQAGQRPLLDVRIQAKKIVAGHQAQGGIAQKLEPLVVVADIGAFIAVGPVHERVGQQVLVAESIAQAFLQRPVRIFFKEYFHTV